MGVCLRGVSLGHGASWTDVVFALPLVQGWAERHNLPINICKVLFDSGLNGTIQVQSVIFHKLWFMI